MMASELGFASRTGTLCMLCIGLGGRARKNSLWKQQDSSYWLGLGRCFFQGLAGAAVDRLLGRELSVQASQWRAGGSIQEGKMEGLAAVR